MEIQHVCVPTAEYMWQRISRPFALHGPIVMSLLGHCIWWTIVFYAFHLLKLFFEGRQRQARSQKLSEDRQSQFNSERKGVEQLCHHIESSPTTAELHANNCSAPLKTSPLVPVSMCVVDDSCGDMLADRRLLLDTASQLRAPGEEVTVLHSCAGPVVQTKLTRLEPASLCFGDTIKTPSTTSEEAEAAGVEKGKSILIQLGRWRVFRTSSTGGKEPTLYKMDDTDSVPVVLHSSYSGGILNVEGYHLRGATIQAVTKNKCVILETKYKGVIESSLFCQVEVFTSESRLPSKNLTEVLVLASKKIEVDGFKLNVNSSAIQIQNDSLRSVLQSILLFTILAIYATRQILSIILMIIKTTNMASVIAWLMLCIVVVATQALPLRIETAIIKTLKKLVVRTYYTIYFATQCFSLDEDPIILNMQEEISTVEDQQVLKNGISSSFQSPSNISIENPAWKWEVYDKIFDKKTRDYKLVKHEQSTMNNDHASQPFIVVYKNIEDHPWASQVEVCVYSPILIDIIDEIIPQKIDQTARSTKKVSLDGPELFRIREDLRNTYTSTIDKKTLETSSCEGTSNREKLWHLQHLLHFMDKEFKEIEPIYAAMNSGNFDVSWEMLWAFFPPKERVVYIDGVTEENLCGDVLKTKYERNHNGDLVFTINVTNWDYNCKTWKEYSINLTIFKFEGEQGIRNLNVQPLQYMKGSKAIVDSFLKYGSEFCELSMRERCCYRNYKGSIFRYVRMEESYQLFKENADGRVMIDLGSFAKMNPDYSTWHLKSANPPRDILRNNDINTIDITHREDRMFAPAKVYGFSFRLKKWGSFSVKGFSHVNYNTSAFDDLVMDEDTKDVVEKIVRKQLEDGKDTNLLGREQFDSIAGKGEGTIFLCYGPPGTGKTLTAESLSELMECPLWSLNVSELGTTPEILETTLLKVFDVAASWGALLLLDEADVFLERRTTSDLTRNAMTGVFLRLLEYFKGVLFLTTNRDCAFDDAILSRIAMKVHYKKHSEEQRKTMWTKMLGRVGLQGVSIKDLAEFAVSDFNGREIRNIVKIAHLLSRSDDDNAILEIEDVKKALKVYKDSCQLWIGNHAIRG